VVAVAVWVAAPPPPPQTPKPQTPNPQSPIPVFYYLFLLKIKINYFVILKKNYLLINLFYILNNIF